MSTSLTSRLPVALIGAGAIGRQHIATLRADPTAALCAIADPFPAAEALAREAGVPWFADHRAMLDAVKPRGAIVATPNATHTDVAVDCLQRGVAVLVEKPIADTVASAQRLCDAAAALKVPVLVGHHRRHNPILRRAREIVASGRLGRIVSATALASFLKPDAYFEMAWRRQAGGGPVLINLIHDIDLLRFLLGEVVAVQAACSSAARGFEVEDTAAAVLQFDSGALAALTVSDTAASPWNWDLAAGESEHYPRQDVNTHFLCGTKASLTLPRLELWHYAGAAGWHDPLTMERTALHRGNPYDEQMRHFQAVIEGREAPLCSASDALRTLQATLAVREAAAAGRTVTLPVRTGP